MNHHEQLSYKLHVIPPEDAYYLTAADPVDISRLAVARASHEDDCRTQEKRTQYVADTLASWGIASASLDDRSVELLHGILTGEINRPDERITDREVIGYVMALSGVELVDTSEEVA